MDTHILTLFVETAQRGSFAAVARALDLDPSAVSRAVASLETDLGVRLFQRTTRRMTLTEAGAGYLARVEPVLAELEAARAAAVDAADTPSGTLRLTASVAFGHTCLTPLLPAFRAAFPSLGLDLMLTDRPLDLIAERIDLAVRLGPDPAAGQDAVAAKLMDTTYRVCAAPGSQLSRPEDLTERRCLLQPLPGFRSRWRFRRRDGAEEREVPVAGDIRISSPLALRDAAEAGLGPALLADWLTVDARAAGRLIDPLPGWQATATRFDTAAWLIHPSRRYVPLKTRAAIRFLRENLRPDT